jgi:choline-glycine betaine transporter
VADTKQEVTNQVAAVVATAVSKPEVRADISAVPAIVAALTPLIDAIVHSTNTEPFYRSRVFWGSLISLLAVVLGAFGIVFPAELQGTVLTIVMAALPLVGGILALYGRFKAKKPLGSS